jgi:hypothetical protein
MLPKSNKGLMIMYRAHTPAPDFPHPRNARFKPQAFGGPTTAAIYTAKFYLYILYAWGQEFHLLMKLGRW